MNPYAFRGRTAVVTGAASGIGEQLAYGLAERGSDLVLIDRDAAGLETVAGKIRAEGKVEVDAVAADLSDLDALPALAAGIREGRRIGLLVNNAGIALGGHFEHLTVAEFERIIDVNFRAPVRLAHALLPALLENPGSHLVNVSSLYGLIAPPGQSAYSSSKFALRGFSESLRSELEGRVGVTTVHPGGVRTAIARNATVGAGVPRALISDQKDAFDKLLSYPPEKAAAEILDGVARRKARVLIAATAKVPDILQRLMPVSHMRLIRALTERRAR